MSTNCAPCAICLANAWSQVYQGPIRTGGFGETASSGLVWQCGGCGVQQLARESCVDEKIYGAGTYLEMVRQDSTPASQQQIHDADQRRNLRWISSDWLRDKLVADVGCSGGVFLDHVASLVKRAYAIEPDQSLHGHLRGRGFSVFSSARECVEATTEKVDQVFCFSVLEHVADPIQLLTDMHRMARSGGRLLLSTPNFDDALLEIVGDPYKRFFYRSVHRFYFHVESLITAVKAAGWHVEWVRCLQRFGIANAMIWLRDGRPAGECSLGAIDSAVLDGCYRNTLEESMRADYLYLAAFKQD